jgi:hypothetical protein
MVTTLTDFTETLQGIFKKMLVENSEHLDENECCNVVTEMMKE